MRRASNLSVMWIALAVAAASGSPARAGKALNLASFVCTRSNDGRAIAGNRLAAKGFVMAARARHRHLDVVLVDPETAVRANCVLRKRQVW